MTIGTTVLIWFAADQSVTKSEEIILKLDIKPRTPDSIVVAQAEPQVRNVKLLLKGPNRSINQLRESKDTLRVEIEIDKQESGVYNFDLADAYRRHIDQFPEGLAVASVEPRTISIVVDRYVERQVPLRIEDGTVVQPEIDPPIVTITAPETEFEKVALEDRVITLDIETWKGNATPGDPHSEMVVVFKRIEGLSVLRVEPEIVEFRGTLLKRTVTHPIKTMPIGIKFNSNELTDYRIRFGEGDDRVVTVELEIEGPEEVIEKIKPEPAKHIEGFIRITQQDVNQALKSRESIPKRPFFILPDDVQLTRPPEELQVRIIPRD